MLFLFKRIIIKYNFNGKGSTLLFNFHLKFYIG